MQERSYRGWIAATTTAVLLSLVLLMLERQLHVQPIQARRTAATAVKSTDSRSPGIIVSVDPGLAKSTLAPGALNVESSISRLDAAEEPLAFSNVIRRPPEPAANVILFAPVANEFTDLPLHSDPHGITYLMEAMDRAFEHPARIVSTRKEVTQPPATEPQQSARESSPPPPVSLQSKLPEPRGLIRDFSELQQLLTLHDGGQSEDGHFVSRDTGSPVASSAATAHVWLVQAQSLIQRIVFELGLEHPDSPEAVRELSRLADQAVQLGDALNDYEIASRILRLAYSLRKKVDVWRAIQLCLDGTSIALAQPPQPPMATAELMSAIEDVDRLLNLHLDGSTWKQFLLLEELSQWAQSAADNATPDAELPRRVQQRLKWPDLNASQSGFLARTEFQRLSTQLLAWGREPVDYRQLLSDLEELEEDSISRSATSIADKIQILQLANTPQQRAVGQIVDAHYRNANLRLSISGKLIQDLLPEATYEVRPVRKRILGADTHGTSAVQTQLQLQLIPDDHGWNVDLAVVGDMYSTTESSKGPAVFQSTSTAQIDSHRYLRLDRHGYQISSRPTSVNSQDVLRNMRTNYDGLPIVGDFVRLIVREQFNQKRGLAQRLTRRIIAQEADAELDRRLYEALQQAESQLEQQLIGPLETMRLNPSVVNMETSGSRLTVRYRVAHETQLGAHTARPRAPADSLLSLQLHQSSLNNAISQLGLSGRTWELPALAEHLSHVLGQPQWNVPEEVSDVSIRFADTRPISLEMQEGRLRLTLRIAELKQPSRNLQIYQFLVSSNYLPVAEKLNAELVRDGVVEILSSRRQDRVPLRFIFAKIFVSHPEIPLISQRWQTDERAKNLAVSQLEIRDGWLAVALSNEDSLPAADIAARARELKHQ